MVILIQSIIWVLLALLFAIEEARYFFYKENGSKNDTFNPHMLFTCIRALILGSMYFSVGWIIIFLPLLFTFFHDGMYYTYMNSMCSAYPLEWWDQSTTSTSWLDKLNLTGPILRTIYAIIGVAGLIYFNL